MMDTGEGYSITPPQFPSPVLSGRVPLNDLVGECQFVFLIYQLLMNKLGTKVILLKFVASLLPLRIYPLTKYNKDLVTRNPIIFLTHFRFLLRISNSILSNKIIDYFISIFIYDNLLFN